MFFNTYNFISYFYLRKIAAKKEKDFNMKSETTKEGAYTSITEPEQLMSENEM